MIFSRFCTFLFTLLRASLFLFATGVLFDHRSQWPQRPAGHLPLEIGHPQIFQRTTGLNAFFPSQGNIFQKRGLPGKPCTCRLNWMPPHRRRHPSPPSRPPLPSSFVHRLNRVSKHQPLNLNSTPQKDSVHLFVLTNSAGRLYR